MSWEQEQDPRVPTGTACPELSYSLTPRWDKRVPESSRDLRAAFPGGSGLQVLTGESGEVPGALLLLAAQVPRLPGLSGPELRWPQAGLSPNRAVPRAGTGAAVLPRQLPRGLRRFSAP